MDQLVEKSSENNAGGMSHSGKVVDYYRQIMIWPVHILNRQSNHLVEDHATALAGCASSPWKEVLDEFGEPEDFCERHYYEFVTFLPPVQRFLYGQGLGKSVRRVFGESPIRVFRRCDIAKVRVTLKQDSEPIVFDVAHIDLYFFYDIDVAMLAVEVSASNLPLHDVQEVVLQLGRVFPSRWSETGRAANCPWLVEWLAADGTVLSVSDYDNRAKYLGFVCQHRAPQVASHWNFMMQPMVLHHSDSKGDIRYRLLEGGRMPVMAYIAIDNPSRLSRADYVRLAYGMGAGIGDELPFSERYLADFELSHSYDRIDAGRNGLPSLAVRYVSSASSFVLIGDSSHPEFADAERGDLSRFRHQHFLLFLIAHFHKAALSMFSDRLAAAVNSIDVNNRATMNAFRSDTRLALEKFLRFTHRYWFHSLSNQDLAHELFTLCRRHLELDSLYEDIRQEVQEMSQYLENEAMRRQNESMVRLTVVTTFGLIGTVTTGFLGMNLFAHSELPPLQKFGIFMLVVIPTIVLTLYTVMKSRRLSEFLDALSDESGGFKARWKAFLRVWLGRKRPF